MGEISQQSPEQDDQNRRLHDLQTQLRQEVSSSAAHRRELEVSLAALSDDVKASLQSLQNDALDRRDALDRAARNFASADERIGKAFLSLSELNMALDSEKKERAGYFDSLSRD